MGAGERWAEHHRRSPQGGTHESVELRAVACRRFRNLLPRPGYSKETGVLTTFEKEMPTRTIMAAVLMLVASSLLVRRGQAGTFMRYEGTDTLRVLPVRYRIRFRVQPTHLFGRAMCGLDVVPGTFQDWPRRPILAAEGPPGTTWSIDSLGDAHFEIDPCRPSVAAGGSIDSLAIVVDELPGFFGCVYLTTGNAPALGDDMFVPSAEATSTERVTWGRLKSRFR